jgi:hypothetical protein
MLKPIKTALMGIALIALLGLGADVYAQAASDVDCTGCVDTRDIDTGAVSTGKIKNGAVTTGRIKNGAVTKNKVAPELKNAIGTLCPPGQFAVGMDMTGNFVCEVPGPLYFPSGPQVDVPEGDLAGWRQCYQDLYKNSGTTVASILAQCDRSKLLLACRRVGDPNFVLLAAAPRDDVLFDTGYDDVATTHTANGSEWYFNDSYSWGFAAQGDEVGKISCDTYDFGANDKRLCWHAEEAAISGGYRCGATKDMNLRKTWERVIYHAD